MMEMAIDIISAVCLIAGGFFFVVSGIGLNRMPDVFSRMHATSVGDTMGVGLLIVGMCLQAGLTLVTVKLIFILAVVLFIGAVSSHALARAALHDGEQPILMNQKGALVETDLIDLYPELGVRIAQPLTSETMVEPEPEEPEADEEAADTDEKEDEPSKS
ncbi:monovalent cation/H(+) antiporter subunit G [Rhodobacteraceae bacterium NNCM2]|nr:monovalent cation/H(+) antiporter subunit G [Coraliihabitans acroporae]